MTEDELNIHSDDSEDESNGLHRTAASPKIILPEITNPVVNLSTTQESQY